MKQRTPGWARVAIFAALVLATAAASGCSRTPTDTYYEMVAAAKMGDRETFLSAFTDDSRKLIQALLELSDIYGLKKNDPYELLIRTEVLAEEPGEPEKLSSSQAGEPLEVAFVVVQLKHRKRRIKMMKIDGDWKIDAFDLEKFWEKKANFSF